MASRAFHWCIILGICKRCSYVWVSSSASTIWALWCDADRQKKVCGHFYIRQHPSWGLPHLITLCHISIPCVLLLEIVFLKHYMYRLLWHSSKSGAGCHPPAPHWFWFYFPGGGGHTAFIHFLCFLSWKWCGERYTACVGFLSFSFPIWLQLFLPYFHWHLWRVACA